MSKKEKRNNVTTLSFARSSLVGVSRAPQTLKISSRASSCQFRCMARSTAVHVSMLDVVCVPAKKIVLHSSTTSLSVTSADSSAALIMSCNKSVGQSSDDLRFLLPLRPSMIFNNNLRISFDIRRETLLVDVGKNLQQKQTKKY